MQRPPDVQISVWLTEVRDEDFDSYTMTWVRDDDPDVVRVLRSSQAQAHVAAKVLDLLERFAEAHAETEGG